MKYRIWFVLALLILASIAFARVQRAEVLTRELTAVAQDARANVDVEGTLLLPPDQSAVRAVIVVLRWGAGTWIFDDPDWRRLAETLHCGLLGLEVRNLRYPAEPLRNIPGPEQAVRNASVGGAEALLKILEELAGQAHRPELGDARIFLWGHSAAGSFGPTFAANHPSRTIGFVRYHSHSRGLPVDMKTISGIPGLIFAGGKDATAGVEDSDTFWKAGRSLDAPWTFALEPDAEHGDMQAVKKANDLAIPWVRAVIEQRLNDNGKDFRTLNGASVRGQSLAHPKAGWLPDEDSARGWRAVTGVRQ